VGGGDKVKNESAGGNRREDTQRNENRAMNDPKIFPDDPRLTAYALGELADEERAQVAAAVAADPALQAAVEEIRATAVRLTAALAAEPLPESAPVILESYHPVRPSRIFRFPYWTVAALAAAACFAVIIALRELPWTEQDAKQKAAVLAGQTAEKKVVVAEASVGAAQPSNRIDIQFPKTEAAGKSQTQPTPATAADQLGVVVPNPPPAAAVASLDKMAGGAKDAEEQVIQMQPFAVKTAEDSAYFATNTLAGSRLNMTLADSSNASAGKPSSGGFTYGALQRAVGGPAIQAAGEPVSPRRSLSGSMAATGGGQPFNTETYDYVADNDFLAAAQNPLSTFSVDVDTASYSNVRRFLLGGRRPPRDAVRIEELVNYFTYDYAAPRAADPAPFAASLEVAAAPWAPTHRLVRIGLKGRELSTADRPAANLVFLVDVSGSMDEPNKLPLVQESLRMLVEKLKPEDHVAIAVYAGASGLALPSTPVSHRQEILDVLDSLHAGGTTNGAMGIQLAYDVAKANFIAGGVNRVILATDGDFNMGVTDRGDLVRLIQEKAKSGVFLTALGFGMGNYKDATLEQLADKGNGTYAYIDSAREARKVLAEQVNGTLAVIAKDVKVQVEFNPAKVQAYRLIGYENRLLKKEDFNNDKIDAGDIGAGHTVTALYEVVPAGVEWKPDSTVDPLKYQQPADSKLKTQNSKPSEDLLTVKLRYKAPDGDTSKLLDFPLTDHNAAFADASGDFKFAAAVAGFGMVLRDSPYKGAATLAEVLHWAEQGTGSDAGGYRGEFISLVKQAETILPSQG
jgi:Ca-activated chloride channel family protein